MNRSRILKVEFLALLLALTVPGIAMAQNGNGNQGNRFAPQPVLVYTMAGDASDTNQNALVLVVYNNGFAILSQSNDEDAGGDCSVQTATFTQQEVNQLFRQLRRAGALRSGGGPNQGSEDGTPLSTLTLFVNTGNGRHSVANSFSFFDDGELTGSAARIQTILSMFIDQFGDDDGS